MKNVRNVWCCIAILFVGCTTGTITFAKDMRLEEFIPPRTMAASPDSEYSDPPFESSMPLQNQVPPAGVRKINDGALNCRELYVETERLQQRIAEKKAAAATVQREASAVQDKMFDESSQGGTGGGFGSSLASSLLGMIPGGGMVGIAAMQASASARQATIQNSAKSMMQLQLTGAEIQQDIAYAEARHDHLVDLFLRKACPPIR